MANNVWVEKYRPSTFQDILLDDINTTILTNILATGIPNLLLYGPPGTGKTTTIINLIKEYQQKTLGAYYPELIIHLNASDDRGIDVIRVQIYTFISSKTMFNNGMKFVVLDEVDYMTTSAQQALKCILQTYPSNVVFCLMCNYISKIDIGLQSEFVRISFSIQQIDSNKIVDFLAHIAEKEQLNLSRQTLMGIQKMFCTDIRSMINYMQSNQYNTSLHILSDVHLEELMSGTINENVVYRMAHTHKCSAMDIIIGYLTYILHNHPQLVTNKFLTSVEIILHSTQCTALVPYFISNMNTQKNEMKVQL